MIEADKLTKVYPATKKAKEARAVDGLSLRCEPGKIYGLLGANGGDASPGDAGNNIPRTMLDHKKGWGTEFRGPGFQLDTRNLQKGEKPAENGAPDGIARPRITRP